jgi:signal transduction histidine kinase
VITRSLRFRLLLGAAAAILVALLTAWAVMVLVFERHLERRLEMEMTQDGLRLAAGLTLDARGRPGISDAPADPRLQTPAGGYYWQASGPGGATRSRSLWDADLPRPRMAASGDWTLRRSAGPYGETLVLLERQVIPDADMDPVLIQLAQDVAPVRGARDEFAREIALFLAVLWIVLSAAAWAQVQLGLRPLARVRRDLAALRDNPEARLPQAALREIQPLTDAINALAGARERDLELARRRAADLAHGLKTPLSALAAQSRRAREAGADQAADGLDRAIEAIRRAIEAELALVRAAMIRRGAGGVVQVRPVVEQVIDVLEHTEQGAALVFSVDVPEALQIPVRREDLAEMIGPVLENATRFSRRRVWVSGSAGPEWTRLAIEDDGPGIARSQLERVVSRGVRLDQSGDGAGLGLAIAGEMVRASGGQLGLASSPRGGLRVEFIWVREP